MASPGQIDSEELAGALGVETEKPKAKIGIEISAPGVFAAFTCGTTPVSIRGAVIGSVKAGKPGSSLTINFKASKGVQKPNHFVGGPEQKLEASFGGGPVRIDRPACQADRDLRRNARDQPGVLGAGSTAGASSDPRAGGLED